MARPFIPFALLAGLLSAPAWADSAALAVSNAWAPAGAQSGADVAVYMNITNPGGPDALLRVRCPIANFAEKRVIDLGEGAPSAREVKALPIPSGRTMLTASGPYIQLLQLTQALALGETFTCKLAFQSGESREVEVTVKSP